MVGRPSFGFLCYSLVWLACLYLFPSPASTESLLTQEQRAWLARHPVIRVAVDPHAPPFEWIAERGKYQGICAELLDEIGSRLGVRFEILVGRDWADALTMVRERKADLLAGIVQTKERSAYLLFTRPYLELPGVIISAQSFASVEALAGHKVAVVEDSVWDERVTKYDDRISIIRVEDTRTALDLTALGGVDAMVSNLASVTYHIGKEGFANLQIVGRLSEGALSMSLAVRNDWPELAAILQRALNDIPPAKIEAIKTKWMSIDERSFYIAPIYGYSLLAVLLVMLASLVAFIAWNRSLKHRVELRTRELASIQERLAEARKLESVAQLALGVAHEIKNPLSIIQLGIDYLSADRHGDEAERMLITDLEAAVQRAAHIVESLQVFSRREQVSTSSGDLNTLVREVVAEHEQDISAAGITLEVELSDDLEPFPMDRLQLRQALSSLIRNACQAMEQGGTLRISSRRKTLSAEEIGYDHTGGFRAGDAVDWVEIRDSGRGIPEKAMDKIFNPFFSTLPQGEGLGLGLPIAQNIVKLHNGALGVRNRSEGGVSVVLIFKTQQERSSDDQAYSRGG